MRRTVLICVALVLVVILLAAVSMWISSVWFVRRAPVPTQQGPLPSVKVNMEWLRNPIHFPELPGSYTSGDWACSLTYGPEMKPEDPSGLRILFKGRPLPDLRENDRVQTPWGLALYTGKTWIVPGRAPWFGISGEELTAGRDITPEEARPVHPATRPTTEDVVRDCITAIRDIPAFRRRAIRVLGRIGPPAHSAIPELVAEIDKDDGSNANAFPGTVWAIEALGRIGPAARSALPAIRSHATDRNPNVRAAVAWALVRIAPSDIQTKTLLEILASDTEEQRVRAAAVSAMKELSQ